MADPERMKPAPYYESRFVRANHPSAPQALWLRETLLVPSVGDAVADVWVMVFDPEGAGNRAIKVGHPLSSAEYSEDPWTARIAGATITDTSVRGTFEVSGRTATWSLDVTPGTAQAVKLLTDRGYRARFPTAKTMVRHPLATFDGTLDLDGTVTVAGWRGSVNHNWGRRHTPSYAFGQVCGFDDAADSSLEVVTARAAVGPVSLPPATLFVLRHAGREYAVRSILETRRTHGTYRPYASTFGGSVGRAVIEGELTAQPADVIGLTYADTTGHTKYCYNSALATCRIRLSDSALGTVELVATRRAMFEILLPEPRADVALLA